MPGTRSSISQTHLQGVRFQVYPKNPRFSQYPNASLSERSSAMARLGTPRLKGKLFYTS